MIRAVNNVKDILCEPAWLIWKWLQEEKFDFNGSLYILEHNNGCMTVSVFWTEQPIQRRVIEITFFGAKAFTGHWYEKSTKAELFDLTKQEDLISLQKKIKESLPK